MKELKNEIKQKFEKLNLCCLSTYRKTSPSGQHRFMQVFKLKAPTIMKLSSSFLPQTRKRYIPAWVRKACNWCCNRKEENHKADKANPLSLSQHCNFHSCSLLLSSLIKLPQFWNIEIYNNTQHHDSRSYIRWWILSYITFCFCQTLWCSPQVKSQWDSHILLIQKCIPSISNVAL